LHELPVKQDKGPNWTYNDDPVRPTFMPSVLVQTINPNLTDEQLDAYAEAVKVLTKDQLFAHPVFGWRCHAFILSGQIQFLDDCTHSLRGSTVPLPQL